MTRERQTGHGRMWRKKFPYPVGITQTPKRWRAADFDDPNTDQPSLGKIPRQFNADHIHTLRTFVNAGRCAKPVVAAQNGSRPKTRSIPSVTSAACDAPNFGDLNTSAELPPERPIICCFQF